MARLSRGVSNADVMVPELIKQLQASPQILRAALSDIGDALARQATITIDQQKTPYGEPWPLTKEGKPALIHASRWLTWRVRGSSVRLVIRGYMGLHDLGRARGHVRRSMLPTAEGGLPATWAAIIESVVAYHLVRALP